MRPSVSGRTRLAAVIGDPVRHSLSPVLFDAAASATGVDLSYVALEVSAANLADALAGCRAMGFVGLNVTMPHKESSARLVDRCTERALRLGAVNCITVEGGRLVGDSTDGAGFLAGLRHDEVDVAGRQVAVIGAGGAARSIIAALAEAGVAGISVHNRTASKAQVAADLAGPLGRVGTPGDVEAAELVVNATPLGMGDDVSLPVDPELLRAEQVVVDIVYHPLETPLLRAAVGRGARAVDGVGMLVGQAAVAFQRWTCVAAPLDVLRDAARRHLQQS